MGKFTGLSPKVSHIRRALSAIVVSSWLIAAGCGGSSPSDRSLTTQIQSKLYSDAATKGSNVGVAVKDGVVTLSGNVADSGVALEAMKIANGTTGVKSVQDNLTVNGTPAANQTESASTGSVAKPEPEQPAPQPAELTVPAGQRIEVRTIDTIDSSQAEAGQTFRASLGAPLVADGRVVARTGSNATLTLVSAKQSGRIKGHSILELRLTRVQCNGKWYPVDSSFYEAKSKSRGKQTAIRTGIGAAAGAAIGAIAGGGKGAAIGSAIGGGGGLGLQLFTHGTKVKIPSETVLTFRLEKPLTVAE
ncbi:MAG TPA: BON domain-containing protein [Bryobacteraceae bacterium]